MTKSPLYSQFIPYLAFDGNCAEAMRFYAKVLGGKLEVMTHGQSPYAAQVPKEHQQRVMHARLSLPHGATLFAGDCPPGTPYSGIQGVMVVLNFDSASQAERVFEELADGGRINMPMGESFWARRFGMLIDKFGCPWGINGELLDFQMPI